jgi:gluconokinase
VDVVVGADIGTTSAKAVAFDARGRAHGHGEEGYPLHQGTQNAMQVAGAAVAAIRAAETAARESGARVAGIGLSAAMHSLAGIGPGGEPCTPLLTWADTRAAAQAGRLRADHPELHDRTGTPLHPMAPLAKLVWLRECDPATFARAERWAGIKELVCARLCGEWVIDVSCASGTGLMALDTLDWDEEALALAGVGPEQLSRIVPVKETLPADVPLVVGAGDGPLANLGVGAVRPGIAACSIGTSGALRLMVEDPAIDRARRLFCYALTPGRWVTGGAINNGGSVLQWVGEALAPDLGPHAEDELLALAEGVPAGSDGLVMLPYLLSERAPHWSAIPRGAYVGLQSGHGRGHLVRAAIEGVCQQLALVLASLRDAGFEVREIRGTGGFARSALWRQMLADVLGMPVGFAAGHEGSAFGAALVAMEALGLIDSIDVAADVVAIDEHVEPREREAAVYARLLPLFERLSTDLDPAFRALRELTARPPAAGPPTPPPGRARG